MIALAKELIRDLQIPKCYTFLGKHCPELLLEMIKLHILFFMCTEEYDGI